MTRWSCGTAVAGLLGLLLATTACGNPSDDAPASASASVRVLFEDSAIHAFSADERAAVIRIAESAVTEVRVLLPGLEPQIRVEVSAGTAVIPETGEVGAAMTPQLVRWVVDPGAPGGVTQVASTQLRSTLFHELHHTVRGHVFSSQERPGAFIDLAISEGMASVFERDAAGDREVLWAQYPPDVDAWVVELLELPLDADRQTWMFQHPDGRRWIGYRAGAYLVDRAKEASGRSAADLVRAPAAEVLDLAGFGDST